VSANTLPVQSQLRTPRGIVQINGVVVPFDTIEANNNVFYAADTFRVILPLSALPPGAQLADITGTGDVFVGIWAGFPNDPTQFSTKDLKQLIYGKADAVSVNVSPSGNVVELNGRDLTAPLVDTKTVQKYPNLTSSQIAAQLAANHGLMTNITPTSTKVGTYYEIDHIQLQDDKTEWDLLTYLARQEGYVVYVTGSTLNFVPEPTASGAPYRFVYTPPTANSPAGGNFTGLRMEQAKTLANDVKVVVHSWDRKNSRGYSVTATASHVQSGFKPSGNTTRNGGPQIYSRTIANLSKDQAQARANQLLIELSKHELKIEIDGPADMLLDRMDTISLTGTGTAFDTVYFPSSIIRTLSPNGFTWRVFAKNQSPETSTVV
jgi:phage protein D